MLQFKPGVAAFAAAVCAITGGASAELVLLGGAPTGSFVQYWTYNGVGPSSIDHAVVEFVSQTAWQGGPSTQNGWIGAEFHSGWNTLFLNETVVHGGGTLGTPAYFDIHLEDPPTDVVTFRFWGYQNGQAVFGQEIVTTANPYLSTIQTSALNLGLAPPVTLIPIPSGAAVGLAGLAGLAMAMAARHRALRE